jgi:hypothetical protein
MVKKQVKSGKKGAAAPQLFCGFLTFVRNDCRRVQADIVTTCHAELVEASAE